MLLVGVATPRRALRQASTFSSARLRRWNVFRDWHRQAINVVDIDPQCVYLQKFGVMVGNSVSGLISIDIYWISIFRNIKPKVYHFLRGNCDGKIMQKSPILNQKEFHEDAKINTTYIWGFSGISAMSSSKLAKRSNLNFFPQDVTQSGSISTRNRERSFLISQSLDFCICLADCSPPH